MILICCQPGPDSVGIFAISQRCGGVAARACGLVSLEPSKVIKIKELYLCSEDFDWLDIFSCKC